MHSSTAFLTSLLTAIAASSPAPLAVRQGTAEGRIDACTANTCSQENGECPAYGGTSAGYPDCVIYPTDQLSAERGYPRTEAGQVQAWFDFPQPDTGCKYILRSPAGVTTYENCGIPQITVSAAACQLVTLESTFMLQFCCNSDCNDAGGIGRNLGGSGFGTPFVLNDKNGNPLAGIMGSPGDEQSIMSLNVTTPKQARHVAAMPEARSLFDVHSLAKRDCGFEKTEGPYTKLADYSEYVAGPFSCPQGGTCTQEISETFEISRSISIGTEISDPFGIISVSLDVTFEESYSHTVSQSFQFPESSTGYVSSTPVLECYKGRWTGCDEDDGIFEACHVNPGQPKSVDSAVITRSKKRSAVLEVEEHIL
ncbi:hypothetical protein DE146DRAFT_630352 [Phaeosphaeria sp. MPI-PUGE-AT-0046c]|nr:hypothetical protein DE146DRAFT_630352 [Phaeosphaeria sp. MPI-PUGE-AT-0046c]